MLASAGDTPPKLSTGGPKVLCRRELHGQALGSPSDVGEPQPQGAHRRSTRTNRRHLLEAGIGVLLAGAFIDALEADGAVGADNSGPHIRSVLAAYCQDPRGPPGSLTPKR